MTPRTSSYFSGEVKLVVKLGGAGGGGVGVCLLVDWFVLGFFKCGVLVFKIDCNVYSYIVCCGLKNLNRPPCVICCIF